MQKTLKHNTLQGQYLLNLGKLKESRPEIENFYPSFLSTKFKELLKKFKQRFLMQSIEKAFRLIIIYYYKKIIK